jgi:hypothetical protein
VNIGPRDVILVSMAWLGLLMVTANDWWKPLRDFVQGKTH